MRCERCVTSPERWRGALRLSQKVLSISKYPYNVSIPAAPAFRLHRARNPHPFLPEPLPFPRGAALAVRFVALLLTPSNVFFAPAAEAPIFFTLPAGTLAPFTGDSPSPPAPQDIED